MTNLFKFCVWKIKDSFSITKKSSIWKVQAMLMLRYKSLHVTTIGSSFLSAPAPGGGEEQPKTLLSCGSSYGP